MMPDPSLKGAQCDYLQTGDVSLIEYLLQNGARVDKAPMAGPPFTTVYFTSTHKLPNSC